MVSMSEFCGQLWYGNRTILQVITKLQEEKGYPASERKFGKTILKWVFENLSEDGTLSPERVPGFLEVMGVKYDEPMCQGLSAPQQVIHCVFEFMFNHYLEDRPSAVNCLADEVAEKLLDPGSQWIRMADIGEVEDYIHESMFLPTAVCLSHFGTLLHRDDAMHIDTTRLKGRLEDFEHSSPKKVRKLIALVNAV